MKGIDIKQVMQRRGVTLTELAASLGESQQNLSAALSRDDLKSSLIERIAKQLGVPVSYLYGEESTATVGGNGQAVAGVGNILNDGILIDEIAAQRRLTEQALSQNDRLIGIINNLTSGKK